MTKNEIEQIKGQFGLFDLNGSKYHKLIVGYISEVTGNSVMIERNQGKPIFAFTKNIEGFDPLPDKRGLQFVCPACLGSSGSEINGRIYKTDQCKLCNGTGRVSKVHELVE